MSDGESHAAHPGPLEAFERRILGVLVEKAKTTPDAYPLSLNALRSGCNQKSNRFPQMEFDEDQLDRATDSLRAKGALTVVQGDSRVERYRHRLYEWLGVEKAELAVVAELLCRGAQTVGELRGRAARMEPIAGMSELRPILEALVQKGLVEYYTPPGRGAVVGHTFYTAKERDRVRRDLGLGPGDWTSADDPAPSPSPVAAAPTSASVAHTAPPAPQAATGPDLSMEIAVLREDLIAQIAELRNEVERLKQRVEG